MVFSSLPFLLYYLPAVLLLYYLCPRRGRNALLFAASLFFYAWGEPVYVLLMLFSVAFNYLCGLWVGRRRANGGSGKAALVTAIVGNLGLLGFFKYTGFLLDNFNALFSTNVTFLSLQLPIGISFYTFQALSYVIDVYRGTAAAQRNFIHFGTYIALFPQLIAGPIVRYSEIADQLVSRRESLDQFALGVRRFTLGLAKKVLLANQIAPLWEQVSASGAFADTPALTAWLGILAFTFQIYFDFSGYSDMAIGLGHFFGFTFAENFRTPYGAQSITEFWRRWHISLSGWFREYLYIPLGGNRRGRACQIRNLLIVWTLTGLWHGASWNFLLWGLYFGVLLILEKQFLLRALDRLPALLRHAYALLLVVFGWVLFALEDFGQIGRCFASLFGAGGLANGGSVFLLSTNAVLLVCCALGSTSLPRRAGNAVLRALQGRPVAREILCSVTFAALLLLCVACLVGDSYNPFLYFRF